MEPESEIGPPMEPESEIEPPMTGLENEFKTIPTVKDPQAEEDDEGVLFGDAPEQRTKNPRYN
jgi:hypothetical protein